MIQLFYKVFFLLFLPLKLKLKFIPDAVTYHCAYVNILLISLIEMQTSLVRWEPPQSQDTSQTFKNFPDETLI